jgi:hypothetical protein
MTPFFGPKTGILTLILEAPMRHRATLLSLVLLPVLCTTLALAQISPKPGPEAKKLSIFVGKWKLDGDVKPGGMGPGGKTTGTVSCEWIAEGFGVLCHETVSLPGTKGKLTDVDLMAYDDEAKNYFFSQVSVGGAVWMGGGTVNGDKNEIGESLCSQANGLIGFS